MNSVLSEAKQPVELHTETADIPPLFDHSNENPIIYLTEGGNWETSIVEAASLANRQSPVIRTQLKKNRARRLRSALILCQVWWRRGGSKLCSRALACGNGKGGGSQHATTAGRV